MKKNRMLRLASMLMILTLLTTSIVGGTFAKYVTSSTGTDAARVAKWGVTIGASTDLFATSYMNPAGSSVTVNSSNTNKLVAPGTKGTGLDVSTGGTPEVSYSMTIKLDNTAKVPSLKYTPNGGTETTYEPVKFSVYNGTTPIEENISLTDMADLFGNDGKVIYEYDVVTGKYAVNKDLGDSIDDAEKNAATTTKPEIKVEWVWAFEDATNKALCDELDTILGNVAAGNTAPASITVDATTYTITANSINTDVELKWTITATQID